MKNKSTLNIKQEWRDKLKLPYIVIVTEVDATDYLKYVFPGFFFAKASRMFFQFVQHCMIHILKHQVESSFSSEHFDHVY